MSTSIYPVLKMNGLSPDKKYRVRELNWIDNEPLAFEGKAFTGKYLMANGLEIPYNHIVDYHKQNGLLESGCFIWRKLNDE